MDVILSERHAHPLPTHSQMVDDQILWRSKW